MAKLINKADQGELLQPWFLIDFNKDGSLKDGKRVDGAKNDGGGYRQYVQAATLEEAIQKAQDRLMAYRRRVETESARGTAKSNERIASGFCAQCGKEPLVTGRLGAVCVARARELNAIRHSGGHVLGPRAKTDAQRAEKHARYLERGKEHNARRRER